MNFLIQHLTGDFLEKLAEQLLLVGLAVGVAIIIGIPMGIFVLRFPRTRNLAIGIANIMQTIPSLALLAFLLPFLGIGVKPAIVAISIYCLLPLIRNTVIGLESVPAELKEAATALGFSFWQKLWFVELPLALPVIIAGIRIASVMAIGVATLAAFVGAGGFGDYITQGIALSNYQLILLGAIPAALLALLSDRFINFIERLIRHNQLPYKKLRIALSSILLLITFGVIYGGGKACFQSLQNNTVRIASKNFTEQFILAEIMSELIEKNTNLKVVRQLNLGTTDMVHQALLHNETDLYPEYTGTSYLVVLKHSFKDKPKNLYDAVKHDYEQQYNLTLLPAFKMNNSSALIVNTDFARKHNIHNISDLQKLSQKPTIGAPAEFITRSDGYPGLKTAYHIEFNKIVQLNPALMYEAAYNKQVDMIMGFSTDGRIQQYHLLTLKDDKHFYPPYNVAPVIRMQILKAHPEIKKALSPLTNLLTEKEMRKLNAAVDINKQSPREVAHAFLLKKKLIQS